MQLRITAIREETPGVKSFTLAPVDGGQLLYQAGQFLTVTHTLYGKTFRRSYSLSSAPEAGDNPAITVKRIDNGVLSRWLADSARPGDLLHAEGGATGLFTLPGDLRPFSAVWLFAAGIGITPVFALLKAALHRDDAPSIVLIYSNRSRSDTVFYESLRALEARFLKHLTIIWLWSDARDMRRARLSTESFPRLRREALTQDAGRALCYLCGPASYLWLAQLLLEDAGVPAHSVRREAFVIKENLPKHLPADKAPHRVRVQIGGTGHSFTAAYPQSILAAAQSAGIILPYSCNAGQCGSCTAICTEGRVWMSYDEVLTAADLAAGRVLTCTGHAVGGDVVLKYPGLARSRHLPIGLPPREGEAG